MFIIMVIICIGRNAYQLWNTLSCPSVYRKNIGFYVMFAYHSHLFMSSVCNSNLQDSAVEKCEEKK
jgi:hypothetical protein